MKRTIGQRDVVARITVATAAVLVLGVAGICQTTASVSRQAEDAYSLGLQAFKKGDARGALALFESAARARPNDALVANALGNTWFALDEPAKAREEYQRAIKLEPALGAAYKNLGVLECQQGGWDKAQESLTLAARLLPEDPLVWKFLGKAEAENHQFAAAASAFDSALRLESDEPELQLAKARALVDSGQFRVAAGFLGEHRAEGKDSASFDLLLGDAELGEGLATAAAQDYRQAILADPRPSDPYLRLAWLYAEHHHFDAAELTLREGMKFSAEHYPILLQLGRILALGGQEQGASAVLEQAVSERPHDPQAYIALIITYNLLEATQQKAIDTAELALQRCPNNYLLHYLHAGLLLRKQREDVKDSLPQTRESLGAIRSELEESIRLNPDFPHSHYDLARMEFDGREYAKAEQQVKAALIADPQFMSAHYLLGRIYLKQGRTAAGMSEIQMVDREDREEIQRMQDVGQRLLAQQAGGVANALPAATPNTQPSSRQLSR